MIEGRSSSPWLAARLALGRDVQTALETIASALLHGKDTSAAMLSSLEAYAKVFCTKDPAVILSHVDAVRSAITSNDPPAARTALEAIAEYLGNVEIRTPSQPLKLRVAVKPRTVPMCNDVLPSEFKLLEVGRPETEKGRCLFDEQAARDVMADYESRGLDVMIDLDAVARGSCKLKLRSDGSLWAVDARWTPDGAPRLREGRQRYIAPAVEVDWKTRRIIKIIGLAMSASPATAALRRS
jgi:hypothetical protein